MWHAKEILVSEILATYLCFQKLEISRLLEKLRCKIIILKWILKTVWNY